MENMCMKMMMMTSYGKNDVRNELYEDDDESNV